MYCPTCGTEQPPGPACLACGRPFRREARVRPRGTESRRYSRAGVGGRLLGCATTLVATVVVVVAVAAFATRQPAQAPGRDAGMSPALPSPTAELPAGAPANGDGATIVLSEAELNRWLAEHEGELRPASEPRAEIGPGGIAVHVRVYGIGATYRARPVVENGRIVLEDARVEGPLGAVFPAGEVTRRLEAAIDERLATAGMRAVDIELQPGTLTVRLEPEAR
ncbi:MAG: hypothetical protein RMK01_11480 [Thermomicrobium sp.]|nr:hypothetical protein [Thermomicrobium sp.]